MTLEASMDRRHHQKQQQEPQSAANGTVMVVPPGGFQSATRLRLNPSVEHNPDSYEDLQLEFSPELFSSLERYLPPAMLSASRDAKLHYMRDILLRYSPDGERSRLQKHREYRQKIILNYQVDNFERWVHDTKFRIMRPNTMNKFGAVLDDFGLESMLDRLMNDLIRPISRVFFPDVGGSTLDSHHGFVVEYGMDRDVELGFHVDDSEVTLNVCLGKEFSGGELFFRGVRCDNHVNSETKSDEILDYSHVPGHAVIHRGRHRHGARATTSGCRVNLLLWCRSSVFRELKKYQKDCSSWCAECQREKKERLRLSVATIKQDLLKREVNSAS